MYPHRIRLRGPWECTPVSPPGDVRRVVMPSLWPNPGRVRFVRRFGYPGRLDSWERVWLTFEGMAGRGTIMLNGMLLGEVDNGAPEFEITPWLKERNELAADLEMAVSDAGLWGEVALEVRCQAYLRDVQATLDVDRLKVTGELMGEFEPPLELYALLDNSHVAYELLKGLGPFKVASEPLLEKQLRENRHTVRVELIHVSTVWHVIEDDVNL